MKGKEPETSTDLPESPNLFDTLPNEIIVAIFHYLDKENLLKCNQVCKQFNPIVIKAIEDLYFNSERMKTIWEDLNLLAKKNNGNFSWALPIILFTIKNITDTNLNQSTQEILRKKMALLHRTYTLSNNIDTNNTVNSIFQRLYSDLELQYLDISEIPSRTKIKNFIRMEKVSLPLGLLAIRV